MAYVYRHIRKDKNEVFYIGISVDDTKSYRRAFAANFQHRNKYWMNVYNKTDIEAEILFDDISIEEAKRKEVEFIALYRRKVDGGTLVNMTLGGDGVTGYKNKKLAERNKAGIWNGRKHKEESKVLIGLAHKGRERNEEWRKNISISKIGVYAGSKNPNYKGKIYVYKDNVLNKVCEDLRDLSNYIKTSISRLSAILNRGKNFHKGFYITRENFGYFLNHQIINGEVY